MFNEKTFVNIAIVLLVSTIICFCQLHPAYQLHSSWLMLNLEAADNIGTIKKGVTWALEDLPRDPNPLFKIFVSPPLISVPTLLRYCRQFPPPSPKSLLP